MAPHLWIYYDYDQLPQGVGDTAIYFIYFRHTQYQSKGETIPPEIQELKNQENSPFISFSGAFYRGLVDIDLFYRLAHQHPERKFVIVGESYQWNFQSNLSNLFYLGSEKIRSWLTQY
ncbi:MAG TPA: hypothetical protein DDW50_03530 [Firmicutes bacterium]|nr:hypothetical protein [Bacillota bacterium]